VTERRNVMQLVSEAAPDVRDGSIALRDCRVELAHYGRQHRCTLRYVLEGVGRDGAPARRVVYGKVASDGSGERTQPIIAALRAWQSAAPTASQINIPRTLGFRPDLQLLLLEAIPGKPQVAQLLKARLAGKETSASLTLEDAIDACARIAAGIHSSNIALGHRRTLESELDWLGRSTRALRRVSPELGAQLQRLLDAAEARARATAPLSPCFSHGDFTYTQLVFDGAQSGLVDFDTVCQAEPALDLGQFLAYQRLAILKDQRSDRPLPAAEAMGLTSRFLDTYIDTLAGSREDVAALRARVQLYETLMLLRLAIHSWQKLKVSRLAHALTLLEEQAP
jgi:thiamine kinase-like enzyme